MPYRRENILLRQAKQRAATTSLNANVGNAYGALNAYENNASSLGGESPLGTEGARRKSRKALKRKAGRR
jgi:hypothetical protein